MKKIRLATTGFDRVTKCTHQPVLLDEMHLVVPWAELVSLIQPLAPSGAGTEGAQSLSRLGLRLRCREMAGSRRGLREYSHD